MTRDKKIINLLNGNGEITSEAIQKSKQNKATETGLKILTLKQMFQRLPVVLGQVKFGKIIQKVH